MSGMKPLLAFVLGAALATRCGADPMAAPEAPSAVATAPSLQLKLGFQQSRTLPAKDLTLQFIGYQDTRCPADVQCVWAGEARAFFWVSGAALSPQVLTLTWNGGTLDWNAATRVGPYRMALLALEPQPQSKATARPLAYRATVAVRPGAP